jgi:hypothetical protein
MANGDDVGAAIQEREAQRVQRTTDLQNQLFDSPSTTTTPITVGEAIKQQQVAGIQRGTALENQLFGFQPAAPAPSSNDLIDSAISARRGALDAAKTRQMAILGILPPSAAGLSGVVLPSTTRGRHGEPSQYDQELAKLKFLEHEDTSLSHEQYQNAHLKAAQAAHDFHIQRESDTATQTAGFYAGLSKLKSPIGTPEHAREVVALADKYPLALKSKEARDTLAEHADLHDNAQRIKQAVADYTTAKFS